MLIGLVFALGCIGTAIGCNRLQAAIGTAESQCNDTVRKLSSECGVNGNGGVCCNYKNKNISKDEVPYDGGSNLTK